MSQSPSSPDQPQGLPTPPPLLSPAPTPPLALGYAMPSSPPIDLRAIASRQRAVIGFILMYFILAIGGPVLPGNSDVLWFTWTVLVLATLIGGAISVFMMCLLVSNDPIRGILGAVLVFIPVGGLFILLAVNHDATKILRRHGVRAGLLGASLRQVPPPGQNAGR